jgi:CheY-like chemotaxis protein
MRILLVDDSKPIRMANQKILERAGYEVITAVDGQQAIVVARSEKPDLILLDLLLPGVGGIQVLRELKRDPGTANIPVVILSGLSQKNGKRLIAEGADEYLEKNVVIPSSDRNDLPLVLRDVICRINRKKGRILLSSPIPK